MTTATAIGDLTQTELATLAREWFLHGHLQDRVGIPLLYQYGVEREAAEQVAIEEWAGASPLYSVRTQETLGFRGSSVDVILKNLQADIGSPLQYMDFRMRFIDPDHAEFWLEHCGALLDVEPMGEDWVHGMCHTIEDPTFDATAAATNPQAVVRPVHRPPRTPTDRMPHCHWTVTVDPDGPPAQAHPNLARVEDSLIAALPIRPPTSEDAPEGHVGYSHAFDPDLRYEDFSSATLVAILREAAIQSHLLLRSYLISVGDRLSPEHARELAPRILVGAAPVTAGRLAAAFATGDDLAGIAKVLSLHPSFQPADYVDCTITTGRDTLRLAFGDAPVFAEADGLGWLVGLDDADDRGIDAIVRGVNPRAAATRVDPRGAERIAYEIIIETGGEPRREEAETALARFSGAAEFRFH